MPRTLFLGVSLILALSFASFTHGSDISNGVYQLKFRYTHGGSGDRNLAEGARGGDNVRRAIVSPISGNPQYWSVVNNNDGTVTLQSKSSGNYLDIGELGVINNRVSASILTIPRNSQSQARSWSLVPSVIPEDSGRYYIEKPEPYYQFKHPIVAPSTYDGSLHIRARMDYRSESFEFVPADN